MSVEWWAVSARRKRAVINLLRVAQFCWAVKVTGSDVFVVVLIPWLAMLFGIKIWISFTVGVLVSWLAAILVTSILKMSAFALLKRQHFGSPAQLPPAFVLYLRPFAQDSDLAPPPADPFRRSFEGHIVDGFAPLPIIALRAGVFLWETPGLAWVVVRDNEWQSTVEYLAMRARYILVLAGESSSLRWEVNTLIERIPPQRFLLLVRRPAKPDYDAMVSNVVAEWEIKEVTRKRYRDFAKVFPHPLPPYVGGTVFVAFPQGWGSPQLVVASASQTALALPALIRTYLERPSHT